MQAGNLFRVASVRTVNFLPALVTNAAQFEDLALPEGLGAGRVGRCRVRGIQIVSVQNLAWEVWLMDRTGGVAGVNCDTAPFRGRWSFVATDGKQIAGAGLFYYYIDGLDIPYQDLDGSNIPVPASTFLHLGLVNRDVTPKVINAGGELTIRCMLEPTYGF